MSWIASAIILLSIIMIGQKNKWGWIVANVGAILFIVIYLKTKIYGGIALDLVLLVMNTYNFIKWNKNDQ